METMRYQYTQLQMGVEARIVLYAPNTETAERAARAAYARFAALEDVMSDYRATSEVMRLCARAGGPPVPVSADLFRVLERAQTVARRSEGAFDVTVGPFVTLWRRSRRSGQLPAPAELREARGLVGWRKMRLDAAKRTVQLLIPGMRLDLGGIAKGDACDQALRELGKNGVTSALIEAGGDITVSGPPPDRDGWRIEIAGSPILTLANGAVSTSGDAEQFVEIGGRRYAHIVDPRTGLGLTTHVAATVVAPDGLTTDPLATAVCILGGEKGAALVRSFRGASVALRP